MREAPRATREQLAAVHDPGHVDRIEALCERGGGAIDLDTVASEGSWEAALRAAGGACAAIDSMAAGDASAAFCGLRPPGHHAEENRAMGFCLFNNVAVAAAHARRSGVADRVLILDWDVHHGNGTEEIFRADPDVLYASIHQSPLYPGTGDTSYAGEGDGTGFTVNLPVESGAGNDEFRALVEHVVVPIARAYRPGLVVVSAGFDAHRADPLATCLVDEEGYRSMGASMAAVARELQAPILVCLEGGYDPDALAASVRSTLDGLAAADHPRDAPAAAAAEPHLSRLAERWGLGE